MPVTKTAGIGHADVAVREALLRHLEAPAGAVAVARRATPDGDVLVVRMSASNSVPTHRRPARFGGFDVDYEVVKPIRAGCW